MHPVGHPLPDSTPAARLRALLARDQLQLMPCCFDALSARLIEQAGFPLTFMSGFAVSAARLALPDTGLIGAEVLFLEAPRDEQEMERFCRAVPGWAMANMLEDGLTPWLPPERLAELGYRLAAYPLSLLSSAVAAMQGALADLQAGCAPGTRVSFGELRRIVGFDDYEAFLERYAD